MKCPKCGYLGFERATRCRNCGYEFSLAPPNNLPELPMRSESADLLNPLEDLALIDAAASVPSRDQPPASPVPDLQRDAAPRRPSGDTGDLPLFTSAPVDDAPMITRPSPPRPPLAVRRATPEVPRLRGEARTPDPRSTDARAIMLPPALELTPSDLDVSEDGLSGTFTPAARAMEGPWKERRDVVPLEPAGLVARSIAGLIDIAVLASVDAIVVYLTIQLCGLAFDDLQVLPKGPLIAFLIVQNGSYLVAFTLGGQTLGKMATGIRVVATRSTGPLDLGRSIVRTVVWTILAAPAGLGFLTAVFSRDRRGLHDRFAGTRVVRIAV